VAQMMKEITEVFEKLRHSKVKFEWVTESLLKSIIDKRYEKWSAAIVDSKKNDVEVDAT
jgi:hypothetical protein